MNINDVKCVHLEITNNCNARCPGCARTSKGKTHPNLASNLTEWSINEIKSIISKSSIAGKTFTLGGTVDEPMMHTNIYEVVKFFIDNGGYVEIYTNTGCNTVDTFTRLAEISKQTEMLKLFFSVDGLEETNHLYRINVQWKKVIENMTAYATQGGKCEWQYLVFKHNENDIDRAKLLADSLGIPFFVRQNMRNPDPYPAYEYKKVDGKLVLSTHMIEPSYNPKFEPKAIEQKRNNLVKESKEDYKEINCVILHQKEIFVSWNKKLWPCCWFANQYGFGRPVDKLDIFTEFERDFGVEWNDLNKQSLSNILQHQYFTELLEKSWQLDAKYHNPICFEMCGNQGIRQKYKLTDIK